MIGMPIYTLRCPDHGVFDTLLPYQDRDTPQSCKCGKAMVRIPAMPRVFGDYPPYQSPVDGRVIEGRKAHREDLYSNGYILHEPGISEDIKRNKKYQEEKFDQFLDKALIESAQEVCAKHG